MIRSVCHVGGCARNSKSHSDHTQLGFLGDKIIADVHDIYSFGDKSNLNRSLCQQLAIRIDFQNEVRTFRRDENMLQLVQIQGRAPKNMEKNGLSVTNGNSFVKFSFEIDNFFCSRKMREPCDSTPWKIEVNMSQ